MLKLSTQIIAKNVGWKKIGEVFTIYIIPTNRGSVKVIIVVYIMT